MKVQIEELSPIRKKLIIEVEAEKVKSEWDSVVKNLTKKVKLKGFRPGKVPYHVLTKYYGPQIEEEVLSHLINKAYPEALQETGLRPVAVPELDQPALDKDQPLRFQATVEHKPEIIFSDSDYQGLVMQKSEGHLTDQDVAQRLEAIRKSHGELMALEEERPLREGDFAVINYRSFLEDQPLPQGAADNFDLEVGSRYFNPEFEKELPGMQKGESKEFEIRYPDDYRNPSLAGKTVRYAVTLNQIKERHLPELDDQFARSLGETFNTLEELKEKIRADLTQEEERKAESKSNEELLEQLQAKVQFETPEALVNQELQQMMGRIEQDLTRQGLTWEKAGLDPLRLLEKFRDPAHKQVRNRLLLEKIAQVESLTITPDELEAELQKIARGVNQSATLVREIYGKNNLLAPLEEQLLEQKTLKFLRDHATLPD